MEGRGGVLQKQYVYQAKKRLMSTLSNLSIIKIRNCSVFWDWMSCELICAIN